MKFLKAYLQLHFILICIRLVPYNDYKSMEGFGPSGLGFIAAANAKRHIILDILDLQQLPVSFSLPLTE